MRETPGRFTELIPAAARSIPNAEANLFEEVGHIANLEITERFRSHLQSFLGP